MQIGGIENVVLLVVPIRVLCMRKPMYAGVGGGTLYKRIKGVSAQGVRRAGWCGKGVVCGKRYRVCRWGWLKAGVSVEAGGG